jgi:hypothetical protein
MIHPLTKATCGSLSHTYRLPEKSFSPSIPLTTSEGFRISSVLIKDGAKVFDDGVPPREFARTWRDTFKVDGASATVADPCERFLACDGGVDTLDNGVDGERTCDFGLHVMLWPGEGEAFRENGLLRTEPIVYVLDTMFSIPQRLRANRKWCMLYS